VVSTFEKAGAVSVVQVRANKSGKKRKSHKECHRARLQIDSTKEDLPLIEVHEQNLILGEEPKKENKTATQKQTLNSRKDMVQWQNMGYSKKKERRVAFCCNDSVELGAWVKGIHMSIPKNLVCLRTNQPLFSSNFIFVGNRTRPIPVKQDLEFHFFGKTDLPIFLHTG